MQKLSFYWCPNFFYFRSDIAMEVFPEDVINNRPVAEGVGSSVIVREKGHYFGKCIYFDPPDMAPVGMDNKVNKVEQSHSTNIT